MGLSAIVQAAFAERLASLSLFDCGLDDTALTILFKRRAVRQPCRIVSGGKHAGRAGIRGAGRERVVRPTAFRQPDNVPHDDGTGGAAGPGANIAGLADTGSLKTPLGPESVRRLLAGPLVRGVDWLDLTECALGDEGTAALATVAPLPALRALWLGDNRIGDAGAAGRWRRADNLSPGSLALPGRQPDRPRWQGGLAETLCRSGRFLNGPRLSP